MLKNSFLIYGSPGTGKTTYLINLLRDLFLWYDPNQISFVSFTKKGAYEGRDRTIKEFQFSENDFPYFRTIHSLAFRALGVSRYDIISKQHYRNFSSAMGMSFLGYYTEDLSNSDDKYLSCFSLYKNNPIIAREYVDALDIKKFSYVANNYTRYKLEKNVIDFDDLIIRFIKNGLALPVKIALIDEAQDLTSLQWRFCEVAFKNCERIYISGDDDQAIYEWSGADLKYFFALGGFSHRTTLEKTWRLKQNIFDVSEKLVKKITSRVEKLVSPLSENGGIFYYNDLSDVKINSEETYYFLSRNNYFLTRIKTHVMKFGFNFLIKGEPFFKKSLYNAILKYENYRKHSPDKLMGDVLLKTFLRTDLPAGIYPPWYDAFSLDIEVSNFIRNFFAFGSKIDDLKITVGTIHSVKGGEADNVVLIMDITKNVNSNLIKNSDSEIRVLYVALTRARKNLHIVFSDTKFGYDSILQ